MVSIPSVKKKDTDEEIGFKKKDPFFFPVASKKHILLSGTDITLGKKNKQSYSKKN